MKKTILSACTITMISTANAQANNLDASNNNPPFEIFAVLALVSILIYFILAFMKRIMDYRLKNKIIDKGVSENVAASILQSDRTESRNTNIKWFAILMGAGTGLTITYYTLPLGIHTLAIMCFSIAASFLGYYFFIKASGKEPE